MAALALQKVNLPSENARKSASSLRVLKTERMRWMRIYTI